MPFHTTIVLFGRDSQHSVRLLRSTSNADCARRRPTVCRGQPAASDRGFELLLDDGATVKPVAVIVAAGISHFDYMPEVLAALPRMSSVTAARHHDVDDLKKRDVTVIGAGASAMTCQRCCTRPAPMCASSYDSCQFVLATTGSKGKKRLWQKNSSPANQVWVRPPDPGCSLTSRSYSATFPHLSGSKLSGVIWVPLRLGTCAAGRSTKSRSMLGHESPM